MEPSFTQFFNLLHVYGIALFFISDIEYNAYSKQWETFHQK